MATSVALQPQLTAYGGSFYECPPHQLRGEGTATAWPSRLPPRRLLSPTPTDPRRCRVVVGLHYGPRGLSPARLCSAPARLRRVLSHPQALTQCSRYLASLVGVEQVAFEDTAAAAREVQRTADPTQAVYPIPKDYLARYFIRSTDGYTAGNVLKSMITFRKPADNTLIITSQFR